VILMPTHHSPSSPAQTGTREDVLNGHGIHTAKTSSLNGVVVDENDYRDNELQLLVARINQLELANRRKDESMAILCHELRSPLASIQHGIGVLRSGSGREVTVQRGMHELIERQMFQMRAIAAAGLLDLDRTSRDLLLQPERIELRALLSNVIETLEPDFKRRTQTLAATWAPSSIWVMADVSRVEQVFANLLANASKYADVGGSVALSLSAQDGYAIASIKDSGIGISARALPNIFDFFMQADATSVRSRFGMGIGLALVRTIVELHGGSVTALSAGLGLGSEFIVRMPAEV
jgi:signal transduction histidine kinase